MGYPTSKELKVVRSEASSCLGKESSRQRGLLRQERERGLEKQQYSWGRVGGDKGSEVTRRCMQLPVPW